MKSYRYDENRRFRISSFDCADTGEFRNRSEAIREFTENLEKINEYQQKLFAEQKEGIIFVFQAMDAAGKDGAVRAVLSCLSPQGVSEHSFKVPSAEENRHDFLWRFWDALPEKGSISIFNRSYYEDVLVQKVHKIYEKNRFADRIDMDEVIDKRYEAIRGFEKYLWNNSIRVVKIFLNVSKEEQARRFISRIDTPKKNWKFSSGDIDERAYWDEYMKAYETCINRTARKDTPWYVVPADHKWYARLIISRIVLDELKSMDPKWPVLEEEEMEKLAAYRAQLAAEVEDEIPEDEKESGKTPKPYDVAVGIALKKERQSLSEKKFKKLLEKTVFDSFCERFGVSEETEAQLGALYLQYEEQEAAAEEADLAELKLLCKEKNGCFAETVFGRGKEGRKMQERLEKALRSERKSFKKALSLAYGDYEADVKLLMNAYELSVGNGTAPEEALAVYAAGLQSLFETHRESAGKLLDATREEIGFVAAQYDEMAAVFCEESCANEIDAAESDTDAEPEAADAEPEAEEDIASEEALVPEV